MKLPDQFNLNLSLGDLCEIFYALRRQSEITMRQKGETAGMIRANLNSMARRIREQIDVKYPGAMQEIINHEPIAHMFKENYFGK